MLYMVIFLIFKFDEKLTYILVKKDRKKRVYNITPHTLVNTRRGF